MNEMVEFKIWGTSKYVLVTTDVEDETKYRFKNVRTQKVSSKNVGCFDDNGRHYTLKQCIWKYVPYFKQMADAIEAAGVEIPGFGNYLFLKESKQIWNTKKFNFVDFDKSGNTCIIRNGKTHGVSFNQLVYMTEKKVDFETGFKYIDSTLNSNHFVSDASKIVRMTNAIFQKIIGLRDNFLKQYSNKDHMLSIDYFFDKMDKLDLELPEIEKIQLGILEKYC